MLSAIVTWWRQPFDGLEGRMSPSGFEIQGLVVPAYAVFALALGVLAGAALRRSLAAISLTLAAFVAVRLAVATFLRPRYESPEHETMAGLVPGAHARDWVLSNSLVDAVGRHISAPREDLAILHAQQARIDPQEYLLSLGWRRALSFHPADQFWTFQAIEAGIFFAFAAALIVATVWLAAAVAVVTRPDDPRLDRARLLKSLGVTAAAIGIPRPAPRPPPGLRAPASWSRIPAGASSSSTMRRRIRSSFRPATGSRMRAGTTARPTSGRARRAATSARWSRRCGARSKAARDGIAVSVIDRRAFNKPTAEALRRGIPVVSYNADGGLGNKRLAYVGQDLYQSGLKFGARIVELVRDGDVFLFIATPGQLNIQPRIDGALDAIKDSGKPIRVTVVATGPGRRRGAGADRGDVPGAQEPARHVRRRRRLDSGCRRRDAQAPPAQARCPGRAATTCCRELCARSRTAIWTSRSTSSRTSRALCRSSSSSWSKYTAGLVAPSDTNTGLLFVTRSNVRPYLTTTTRYEGSSAFSEYPVT